MSISSEIDPERAAHLALPFPQYKHRLCRLNPHLRGRPESYRQVAWMDMEDCTNICTICDKNNTSVIIMSENAQVNVMVF